MLSGLFLGTLAMLNILGITRIIKLAEIHTETFDPLREHHGDELEDEITGTG